MNYIHLLPKLSFYKMHMCITHVHYTCAHLHAHTRFTSLTLSIKDQKYLYQSSQLLRKFILVGNGCKLHEDLELWHAWSMKQILITLSHEIIL